MAGLKFGYGYAGDVLTQDADWRRQRQEGAVEQKYLLTRKYTADFDARMGHVNRVDPSGGGVTVTLPRVALLGVGDTLVVAHAAANGTITVNPATNGDTILGSDSFEITSGRSSYTFYAIPSETDWLVL